ncbi:hypothetical protein PTKIN_Ptkin08bG0184500 [Pterospermum kingtungense]
MWCRGLSSSSAVAATLSLKDKKWDALVIGGGHNGLTASAYLARGGLPVTVLERRHVIGGAAVTEEIVPGFKFSRCSYLQSFLCPSLIRCGPVPLNFSLRKLRARIEEAWFEVVEADCDVFYFEISKFSKRDAEAYPRDFMDLLLSPMSKVLNKWFESDILKAVLAGDAIIRSMDVEGGMGSVSVAISKAAIEVGASIMTNAEVSQSMVGDSGTVEGVLLVDGTRIRSSVVLSNATPYKTFLGLVPQDVLPGDFLCAIEYSDYNSVRSLKAITYFRDSTFKDDFRMKVSKRTDYAKTSFTHTFTSFCIWKLLKNLVVLITDFEQGTTKINVAIDKLPQFHSCRSSNPEVGPQHTATIHIGSETMDDIGSACQDAWNGLPSKRPVMEMTIPSSLDKTISPPGKHVISLFTQYTPYKPSNGSWENPTYRESYAQRCFSLIDDYASGFSSSVIGYDMLTPPDLEREFGLTGGNIFHGAMGLDSLFLMRPVKGWSGYRTPVGGLYLCGSGAHPGGQVMGAPGLNAARIVLKDFKKHSS